MTDRKEPPVNRADWPERWERGDLYSEIAADAGLNESTVCRWFLAQGYHRVSPEEPVPYAEYPPAVRALILFYAEGSDQRRWMEARVAAWKARQAK